MQFGSTFIRIVQLYYLVLIWFWYYTIQLNCTNVNSKFHVMVNMILPNCAISFWYYYYTTQLNQCEYQSWCHWFINIVQLYYLVQMLFYTTQLYQCEFKVSCHGDNMILPNCAISFWYYYYKTQLCQCEFKVDVIVNKYCSIVLFSSDAILYNSTVPMWIQSFMSWYIWLLSNCAIWFSCYSIQLNCTNVISNLMSLLINIVQLCYLVLILFTIQLNCTNVISKLMSWLINIVQLCYLVLMLFNTTQLYQCEFKVSWHGIYDLSHCAIWFSCYSIQLNCTNVNSKFHDMVYMTCPIVLFG